MAFFKAAAIACLVASAFAAPAEVEARQSGSKITNKAQLDAALASFKAGTLDGQALLTNIVPAAGPTSIQEASAQAKAITDANPGDIFKSGAEILLAGLAGGDFITIFKAYALESSTFNINLRRCPRNIYNIPGDAPYSLSESQLRQVIYIPPDFTYGRKPPVIFLPGSGVRAGMNWGPNFGKLFRAQNVADPVFVNLPGENLADIQTAAEYVAYAINYISCISNNAKVNTVSWSAGSVDGQWALKYWPSTRNNLINKIAISGDYHGTIFAQLLCPGFPTPGCTPAVAQQNFNSTFIRTLRNNGGDQAYVPTTNIYSIFDEIVQPQADPNASGALNPGRAPVSNTEIQGVCGPVSPGGFVNTNHEGVMYNALAYALAVDAIRNGGAGQVSRVDAAALCNQFAASGLSLADIFATHALIPIAGFNILAFQPKVANEPPIRAYAARDTPAA